MTQTQRSRGVYFLANDDVLELTIAFLNSFRFHNSEIQLCLVPYNDKYASIARLQERFAFTVFDNADVLRLCDAISLTFHGRVCGAYRKLAMWEGRFEEFVYIDVDTIVLANISFAFHSLGYADIVTSHSNMPKLIRFVWKDSILEAGLLSREQIQYAANTGFLLSRKPFSALNALRTTADSALGLRKHMALECQEQPLLNYLIVTSGRKYSSFYQLFREGTYRDVMFEFWAGMEGGVVDNGQITYPGYPSPIFLVHWAGLWKSEDGSVRQDVPYKELWQYYRELQLPLRSVDGTCPYGNG